MNSYEDKDSYNTDMNEENNPYNTDMNEENNPYNTDMNEENNPYDTDIYEGNYPYPADSRKEYHSYDGTDRSDADPGQSQSVYTEYKEIRTEKSGFSTAALVFGIIALCMLFSCCLTILSFIPAIAGIVCAMVAKSRTETWEGTALGGFICSIVALVIFLIMIILGLISYHTLDTESLIDQYYYEQDGGDHHNDNGAF